jgi:hypothetical protein
VLIASGLAFGLAAVAGAAPHSKDMASASAYSYAVPGKPHQDRFTINY